MENILVYFYDDNGEFIYDTYKIYDLSSYYENYYKDNLKFLFFASMFTSLLALSICCKKSNKPKYYIVNASELDKIPNEEKI